MESFLKKLANFFEKRRVFVDTIERYFEKVWSIFEKMGSFLRNGSFWENGFFKKLEFFFKLRIFSNSLRVFKNYEFMGSPYFMILTDDIFENHHKVAS